MTSASLSLAGQTSPLGRYQTLIAMPDSPALPEPALEASNKTPSLGSADATDKVRRNSMTSNSTRSAFGGNKTSQPDATLDTHREQRRDLSHFVIKPYILDDHSSPGAISLKFRLDSIPVRQVQIQKDLFRSEEDGHQSVLDAYLDLCDHERVLITGLIDGADSHTTLKHLKRSFNEISHRGIVFKGVPALRFIMETLTNENQNKRDDEVRSVETAREIAREAEIETEYGAGSTHSTPTTTRPSKTYTPQSSLRSASRHTSADQSIDRHRRKRRLESEQGDTIYTPSSFDIGEPKINCYSFIPRPLHHTFRYMERPSVNLPKLKDVLREDKQSDGSDESSIISDDNAMNDEEAEKAVKELLEKYTTLGAVGRGSG